MVWLLSCKRRFLEKWCTCDPSVILFDETTGTKQHGQLKNRHLSTCLSCESHPSLLPPVDLKSASLLLDHSGRAYISRFLAPARQKPYTAKSRPPGRPRGGGPVKRLHIKSWILGGWLLGCLHALVLYHPLALAEACTAGILMSSNHFECCCRERSAEVQSSCAGTICGCKLYLSLQWYHHFLIPFLLLPESLVSL